MSGSDGRLITLDLASSSQRHILDLYILTVQMGTFANKMQADSWKKCATSLFLISHSPDIRLVDPGLIRKVDSCKIDLALRSGIQTLFN